MFSNFSTAYLALPGISAFIAELVIFLGFATNTRPKLLV